MKIRNLVLAFAAGLMGGFLSQAMVTKLVLAESQPPPAAEIRARSFLLVNDKGVVLGTFSAERGGKPAIRLFDAAGHEIWSAEGPSARPATSR